MPEYGRNIQSMVDYCLTIPDRTERTSCAATIVKVIINLFPKIKEDDNYKQKVWDHLALISGFQLDVDAPYPLPHKQEASQPVATHIDYPMTKIRNRAYGSLVQRMIDKAVRTSNEFERLQIVAQTALYMKKQVLQNGKDSNAEDRVVADIEELSNGVLHYDFTELMAALPQEQPVQTQRIGGQRPRFQNTNRRFNQNGGGYQQNNQNNNRKYGNQNNNRRRY